MPRRTYLAEKAVTPLRVAPPPTVQGAIPPDAPLLSVQQAAAALTEQYGRGFSTRLIREYIKRDWVEGAQFVLVGRAPKIYLEGVRQWVVNRRSGD